MHTAVEREKHGTQFHLLLNLRAVEEVHAGCRARHVHDDLSAQHQVRVVSVRLVLLIVLHSAKPDTRVTFLRQFITLDNS